MAKNDPGIGHNTTDEKLKIQHMERLAKLEAKKDKITEEIKDELNKAKANGFLKTSFKKALKDLRASAEQRQAQNEVELERKRVFELCKDLPMFAAAAQDEEEEEAA